MMKSKLMKINKRSKSDPLSYRSEIATRATTLDRENRTVEAVLATNNPVKGLDVMRWAPIDEMLIMTGATLPRQVPLLDSHDRGSILKIAGSTNNFRIENGNLIGTRTFARNDLGDRAMSLVADGHLTDGSIGYSVDEQTTIPAGQTAKVGRSEYTAHQDRNLRIVTKWTLREDSLTVIGADAAAKSRIYKEIPPMKLNAKQRDFIEARGFDPVEMNEEQIRSLLDLMPQPAADPPAAAPPAKPSATDLALEDGYRMEVARKAELARQEAVRSLAGDDVPKEVLEIAIRTGATVEEAQGTFLRAIRQNRPTIGSPAIITGQVEATRTHLEAACLLRSGRQDIAVKEFTERDLDSADRFRQLSMFDLVLRCLQLDQVTIPHLRDEQIRAAFSTFTLPAILGAVANKSAVRAYQDAPATWRKWCSIGTIPNFQLQTKARITDAGSLEQVGVGGTVGRGSARDEKEQYKIATYAKNFAITREDIYNDDLSVFTKVPAALGQKANAKVADVVYTHLLDNGNMGDSTALFVAGHSNLITSNALAVASLEKAFYTFQKQTDADGKLINVTPSILLVPVELRFTGEGLVKSQFLMMIGTSDKYRMPNSNVLQGLAEVVSEPRLGSSTFHATYSATSWYLMAAPGQADTVEVGFLNGNDSPIVERFENDPDIVGVTYRVMIDVGAKALDWRSMQLNQA